MSDDTLIQALQRVLHKGIQSSRTLIEEDIRSTSGSTKLTEIKNGVVVKLSPPPDSGSAALNSWLFPQFDRACSRVCRSCDYIVFLPRSKHTRLVVLLCELKSGSMSGALAQLRGGLLLAEYAINAVLVHCPPKTLPEVIEYRGVIFWNKGRVQKGATGPRSGKVFARDCVTGLPYVDERAGLPHHVNSFCMERMPKERREHQFACTRNP